MAEGKGLYDGSGSGKWRRRLRIAFIDGADEGREKAGERGQRSNSEFIGRDNCAGSYVERGRRKL